MTVVVAIYRLPAGAPDSYAAAEWFCAPDTDGTRGKVAYEPNLASARLHVPDGYVRREREVGDGAAIIETWHPPEDLEAEVTHG